MPRIGLIKLGCGTNLGKLTIGDTVWVGCGRGDFPYSVVLVGVSKTQYGVRLLTRDADVADGDIDERDPWDVCSSEALFHEREAARAYDEHEWHTERAAECEAAYREAVEG